MHPITETFSGNWLNGLACVSSVPSPELSFLSAASSPFLHLPFILRCRFRVADAAIACFPWFVLNFVFVSVGFFSRRKKSRNIFIPLQKHYSPLNTFIGCSEPSFSFLSPKSWSQSISGHCDFPGVVNLSVPFHCGLANLCSHLHLPAWGTFLKLQKAILPVHIWQSIKDYQTLEAFPHQWHLGADIEIPQFPSPLGDITLKCVCCIVGFFP